MVLHQPTVKRFSSPRTRLYGPSLTDMRHIDLPTRTARTNRIGMRTITKFDNDQPSSGKRAHSSPIVSLSSGRVANDVTAATRSAQCSQHTQGRYRIGWSKTFESWDDQEPVSTLARASCFCEISDIPSSLGLPYLRRFLLPISRPEPNRSPSSSRILLRASSPGESNLRPQGNT